LARPRRSARLIHEAVRSCISLAEAERCYSAGFQTVGPFSVRGRCPNVALSLRTVGPSCVTWRWLEWSDACAGGKRRRNACKRGASHESHSETALIDTVSAASSQIARAASSQTRGGIDSWCIVVSEPLKDVHRLIPLRFVCPIRFGFIFLRRGEIKTSSRLAPLLTYLNGPGI
jgi:hypothetical protein